MKPMVPSAYERAVRTRARIHGWQAAIPALATAPTDTDASGEHRG